MTKDDPRYLENRHKADLEFLQEYFESDATEPVKVLLQVRMLRSSDSPLPVDPPIRIEDYATRIEWRQALIAARKKVILEQTSELRKYLTDIGLQLAVAPLFYSIIVTGTPDQLRAALCHDQVLTATWLTDEEIQLL